MKFVLFALTILSFHQLWASKPPKIHPSNVDIGPVYSSPVFYRDKAYFMSAMGKLYEAKKDLREPKLLFSCDRPSIGGLTLKGSRVFFGDGLHKDNKSAFYSYDLKKKKLIFKIPVDGHIERAPTPYRSNMIVTLGPGGIASFGYANGEINWHLRKHMDKNLHIDSHLVIRQDRIIAASIYENKYILSINGENGRIAWITKTEKPIKLGPIVHKDKIFALATEANAVNSKYDEPSSLMIFSGVSGALEKNHTIRGFNFFKPLTRRGVVWFGTSSGDLFSYNMKKQLLSYVDNFAVPILASPFYHRGKTCVATSLGQTRCYKGNKRTEHKNLGVNVIGDVTSKSGKLYLPTRTGYKVIRRL